MTRDWRIWVPMIALSLVLGTAIVWGYYTAVQNRRFAEAVVRVDRNRSDDAARFRVELEAFLRDTCVHGDERGKVIITVLREARKRALARGDTTTARQYAVAIAELRAVSDRCFATIPTTPQEGP